MDTNERLLLALGEIKEDIGELRADVRNIKDKIGGIDKVSDRVGKLEHEHTRLKTTAAIVSAGVSSVLAATIALAKGYTWGR